jgi:hypothetical protein
MQPAESIMREDATGSYGASSPVWRSLPQSEMRAVLVVVADVFREQSLQMAFIKRDDVIQQIAPATLYPAFCHSILPRTLERSADTFDFHRADCGGDLRPILGVTIEDDEPRDRPKWKRLSQLLDDPRTRRVLREVEVLDAPPIMADDEKAIDHAEGDRWDREEVHRSDGFPVVAQKRKPALGWFGISGCPAHPAGDRSLGEIKPQHQELPVDTRRAPGRILANHPEDQVSNLLGGSLPAEYAVRPGDGAPVQGKPSPVPSHDCFMVHDDESLFPT